MNKNVYFIGSKKILLATSAVVLCMGFATPLSAAIRDLDGWEKDLGGSSATVLSTEKYQALKMVGGGGGSGAGAGVGASDDEETATPVPIRGGETAEEQAWNKRVKKPGKYAFSDPVLDYTKIMPDILRGQLKDEECERLVLDLVHSNDSDLQEKIYGLLINAEKKEDANTLLDGALIQECAWAYWAKAQQEPEGTVTKWHCLAANKGHASAVAYVDQHAGYTRQVSLDFLESLKNVKPKKALRLIEEFENKWKTLCYARPFLDALNECPTNQRNASRIDVQKWVEYAAEWGDSDIQRDCSFRATCKEQQFKWNLKLANDGVRDAMCNAGILLRKGFDGQSADERKALELYLKAAGMQFPQAMYNAGGIYNNGFDGQPADKRKALRRFQQAAAMGMPYAMISAGTILQNGFEGRKPDFDKAKKLFYQAIDTGNVHGMIALGMLLMEQGDTGQALFWLEKASALGEEFARELLEKAQFYEDLSGADDETAIELECQELEELIKKSQMPKIDKVSFDEMPTLINNKRESSLPDFEQDSSDGEAGGVGMAGVDVAELVEDDVSTDDLPVPSGAVGVGIDRVAEEARPTAAERPKERNIKAIRAALREAHQLRVRKRDAIESSELRMLSAKSQETVELILEDHSASVKESALRNLYALKTTGLAPWL